VTWGNDDVEVTVKIPTADWEQIRQGAEYSRSAHYMYEGERFEAMFHFNSAGKGTLQVDYCPVDGDLTESSTGILGRIEDATILGGTL